MIDKIEKGRFGENMALNFLIKNNYVLIERNWRYGKNEIDLIVTKDDVCVFIEVKYRDSDEYGYPENSVTKAKQSMIKKVVDECWHKNPHWKKIRIDIIAILRLKNNTFEIHHLEDAFF